MPIYVHYDGIDGSVVASGQEDQLKMENFQAHRANELLSQAGSETTNPFSAKNLDDVYSSADQPNGIIAILIG